MGGYILYSFLLVQGLVIGSCEQSNELLVSQEGREFPD
jgi:hypothetical protein